MLTSYLLVLMYIFFFCTQEAGLQEKQGQPGSSKRNKEEEPPAYWKHFDSRTKNDVQSTSNATSSAVLEVQRYLGDAPLDRGDPKSDPSLWWRQNQTVYPYLSKLYRKKGCVPATSVPCESLFSEGGLVLTQRRARLALVKASQLLFLRNNWSFCFKGPHLL